MTDPRSIITCRTSDPISVGDRVMRIGGHDIRDVVVLGIRFSHEFARHMSRRVTIPRKRLTLGDAKRRDMLVAHHLSARC